MAIILTTPRSFAGCEVAQNLLRQAGHEVRVKEPAKPYKAEELKELIRGVDALIAGLDEVSQEVIEAGAPTLKIIARNGAGYDKVDLAAAKKQGVAVTTTPAMNSIAVAELAASLMTGLSRQVHRMDATIRSGGWSRVLGHELYGKTIGVLGTGAIGSHLIRICHGFGMNVLAYDLYPKQELVDRYDAKYTTLDEIYRESDYLSLHLPASGETHQMINRETISKMKSSIYLINTARGDLINEEDLYDALKEKRIQGAGLDAFMQEPFTDSRFYTLENVLMTPHSGAYTAESVEQTLVTAAEEVLRVLAGSKPLHPVG